MRGRAADTVERRLSRIDKERKRSDSLFVAEGKSPPVQYKLSANAVVARKFDKESFACERRKASPLAASGAMRPRRVWSTCGRPPLHCCGGELRVRPPATAERAVARSDKMRSILERVGPNEVRSHESTKNGSVCEPFFVHEVKSPPVHGSSIDIVFNHSLRHPLSIQPVIWTRDRK